MPLDVYVGGIRTNVITAAMSDRSRPVMVVYRLASRILAALRTVMHPRLPIGYSLSSIAPERSIRPDHGVVSVEPYLVNRQYSAARAGHPH